ncbi:MAG: crossover junction endodeoxyribonuclease RuvC, partial [Spirochaetaceae bacterium]|nr:crossover junction endodeoxyribonuclease RuvC [Spirochaetaceae bacterium]
MGLFVFKLKVQNKTESKTRRILGIDPGLASTGWGVIDVSGSRMIHIAHGVIETTNQMKHQVRLLEIYNRVLAVLREYNPNEASMEALYFAKNVTSGLAVAEARGVVTLCLTQNTVPL